MPDVTPPASGADTSAAADTVKNLKSEMDRKLGNQDAVLADLKRTNEALLSQLQAITPKKEQPAPKDPSKMLYDDPEGAVRLIEERTEQRVMDRIGAEGQRQQKEATVINQLRSEYPELYDANSDLTRKAIEIFNKLPNEDKGPMGYRVAVKDAAEELGLVTAAKRPKSQDDFTLGNGHGRGTRGGSSRSGELDERTVEFARMCGLDVENPDVLKSIGKRAERTDWHSYRAPK